MKKLLKYLDGSRMQCVLAPLFKMLEATFELFIPLVVAAIAAVCIYLCRKADKAAAVK